MKNLKNLVLGFVLLVGLMGCQAASAQNPPIIEERVINESTPSPKKDVAEVISPLLWSAAYSNIHIFPVSDGFNPPAGKTNVLIGNFGVDEKGLVLNLKGFPVALERLGDVVPNSFSKVRMEINGISSQTFFDIADGRIMLRFDKDVIGKSFNVKIFANTTDVPSGTEYAISAYKGDIIEKATHDQVMDFWQNVTLIRQMATLK